jgi:histidinol phosphatase-like PHP family hydrolase
LAHSSGARPAAGIAPSRRDGGVARVFGCVALQGDRVPAGGGDREHAGGRARDARRAATARGARGDWLRTLHRDPIDCDVLTILDTLAASRGAIEVNADPHRLDLPPAWIPAARTRKIPFVISVDAHSTKGLGVLRYGVTMARRGGIRKDEVLNTRSADAFASAVRPSSSQE